MKIDLPSVIAVPLSRLGIIEIKLDLRRIHNTSVPSKRKYSATCTWTWEREFALPRMTYPGRTCIFISSWLLRVFLLLCSVYVSYIALDFFTVTVVKVLQLNTDFLTKKTISSCKGPQTASEIRKIRGKLHPKYKCHSEWGKVEVEGSKEDEIII